MDCSFYKGCVLYFNIRRLVYEKIIITGALGQIGTELVSVEKDMELKMY